MWGGGGFTYVYTKYFKAADIATGNRLPHDII